MAMLKAKQIKLSAAGDILIGGVAGAGTVLTKGSAGQVLKATAGGLEYANLASTEISHGGTGNVGAALDALDGRLVTAEGEIDTLQTDVTTLDGRVDTAETDIDNAQTEIDAIESAVGLDATGAFVPFTGTNYLNATTTIAGGLSALDVAVKDVADDLANLAGLNALRFVGTITGAALAADLEALDLVQGDVVRIITTGAANFASTGINVNVGDFIAHAGLENTGTVEEPVMTPVYVKFDNTDPSINAAAGETVLVVTGDAYAGYELSINKADVTSANTAITVTGGEDAVMAGVELTFNAANVAINDLSGTLGQAKGGTGITTVTVAGDQYKVLTVGATGGLEYNYVGDIRHGDGTVVAVAVNNELHATQATTAGSDDLALTTKGFVDDAIAAVAAGSALGYEQEEVVVTGTVDYSFTFTDAADAMGEVSVFFNGMKLRKTGFSITGTTLALVDSVNGYSAETGDVLVVSYFKSPV